MCLCEQKKKHAALVIGVSLPPFRWSLKWRLTAQEADMSHLMTFPSLQSFAAQTLVSLLLMSLHCSHGALYSSWHFDMCISQSRPLTPPSLTVILSLDCATTPKARRRDHRGGGCL